MSSTFLTPDHVTFTRLCLGVFSAFLFSFSHYYIAIILLQLAILLDFLDGELARHKNMNPHILSVYGNWIEMVSDHILDACVFFGICWGLFAVLANSFVWIVGFVAIATRLLSSFFITSTRLFIPELVKIVEEKLGRHKIYQYIVYTRVNLYLWLTFAIILQIVWSFLLLVALYGCIFYAVTVVYFYAKVKP